jgi:hypothetical protein
VYLANDVVTQKQLACKVVDLRRNAVDPDGADEPDTSLDGGQRMKVQAYAEKECVIVEVQQKLAREIEILSKLSHVRLHPFPSRFCAEYLSQTLQLSTKHFAHPTLCKLEIRDLAPGD